MSQSIIKELDGQRFEWDGSAWVGQANLTRPPTGMEARLTRLLNLEDWATFGQVPPGGTDEERAIRRRQVALTYEGGVPAVFCWSCGTFGDKPPDHTWACAVCGPVNIRNRRFCRYCGSRAEGTATCPDCGRSEPLDTLSILFNGGVTRREGAGTTDVYVPQEGDHRSFSLRCVDDRRGQPRFREALLQKYHGRCVVTGCAVQDVLEAAHINPHRGPNDDHPENGLLLRADIHTLFDLDLLAIIPDTLRVELATVVANDKYYNQLANKQLFGESADRPSLIALRMRYDIFKKRQEVV